MTPAFCQVLHAISVPFGPIYSFCVCLAMFVPLIAVNQNARFLRVNVSKH
jgi:hypothetical protein